MYALKIVRIRNGLQYLNISYLMDHVKNYFAYMTAYRIERDPTLGENMIYDNNGILALIKINQLLKVSFLVG